MDLVSIIFRSKGWHIYSRECYFDQNLFTDLMKLNLLSISLRENRNETSIKEKNTNLFMMFINLKSLKFDSSSLNKQYISFDRSSPFISYSKLFKLSTIVFIYLMDVLINLEYFMFTFLRLNFLHGWKVIKRLLIFNEQSKKVTFFF